MIIRFRGGNGSVSYDGTHINNYFFKRFGAGIYSFGGSSNFVMILELYYQTADVKGSLFTFQNREYTVPVPLTSIGIEIGLGIPLLK